MVKRLIDSLFSTRFMAILFIIFAIAMGTGTFFEHWYNIETAKKFIYNATWFEILLLLFVLNFLGNIKQYNLQKRRKWPVLLLHLSFIIIIIGAFWTRYIGFEGVMSVREGDSTNVMISDNAFITAIIEATENNKIKQLTVESPILLSPLGFNNFKINEVIADKSVQISLDKYIMNAESVIQEDEKGDYFLKLVVASDESSGIYFIREGETQIIQNVLFSYNSEIKNGISIFGNDKSFQISTPYDGTVTRMSDEYWEPVINNESNRLRIQWLYDFKKIQFVVQGFPQKGNLIYRSNENYKDEESDDLLILNVKSDGQERNIELFGNKGKIGKSVILTLNGIKFEFMYGSKVYRLPFHVRLNKFTAEKYPGTIDSYSSFESDVTVTDATKTFNTKIFMNNVLDYEGYRFFQASFHPDELGTILSVNHDFWGKWITYTGYFFLYIGLISILFDRNSRFGKVRRKLKKLSSNKSFLLLLGISSISLFGLPALAESSPFEKNTNNSNVVRPELIIDFEHAKKFGKLIIQDGGGRMKPINTFASELVRKIHNNDTFQGLSADQVFLSMVRFPEQWYSLPILRLKKENQEINRILNISPNLKTISLSDLFDDQSRYKLSGYLQEAFTAFVPNQLQKDLINLDKQANLLHFALSGKILRIFPIPNHPENKWVSIEEINEADYQDKHISNAKNIMLLYLASLTDATVTKNTIQSNIFLERIDAFQKKFGSDVLPKEKKINIELLYNRINIFERLFLWYLILGLTLIIITIFSFISNYTWIVHSQRLLKYATYILFALHSGGLILRWYISGHAPWSDAYESMIYVSWATILFGLYLGKNSHLTIGGASFISSIILMVAHWNWMDPAIANLQPVLNSYWLMIHVSIIVASYGPFTLGMILGLTSLILLALTTEANKRLINYRVTELLYITELSLTFGLVLLTIGNFLGGQWANESWGRYWGWDPKETWALISIMIYALVIHLRLVPGLKSKWIFGLMGVISYYSILMTYFGVNFYLSGLHSYANGDKVITPSFVYYSIVLISVLTFIAYVKEKKYLNNNWQTF